MPKKVVTEVFSDNQGPAAEVLENAYRVYAEFEFKGKSYKAGDVFTLPEGVTEDKVFTEFRKGASLKGKTQRGIAFNYFVITYKKDEMGGRVEERTDYHTILPVE